MSKFIILSDLREKNRRKKKDERALLFYKIQLLLYIKHICVGIYFADSLAVQVLKCARNTRNTIPHMNTHI